LPARGVAGEDCDRARRRTMAAEKIRIGIVGWGNLGRGVDVDSADYL
jgi:hypothetical protein